MRFGEYGIYQNKLMFFPTTKSTTVENDDQKYIDLINHIQLLENQNKQILSILKQLCDAYNAQQDVEFKQSSTNYQDNQSQSSYTSGVYGTLGRSLQKTYR